MIRIIEGIYGKGHSHVTVNGRLNGNRAVGVSSAIDRGNLSENQGSMAWTELRPKIT